MGITERRAREREQRRQDILDAAWHVAGEFGWAAFSVERVAARAELGRATVYGYFESLDSLVDALAEQALALLSDRVSGAVDMTEALDAPLRFSQARPAAFALLFQAAVDPRPAFSSAGLEEARTEARQMLGALRRLVSRSRGSLPDDAAGAEAFLAGIAMAGVTVPELRTNTPLRRRWQDFCLTVGSEPSAPPELPPEVAPVETGVRRISSLPEPAARKRRG
jgi:AcrR family transcriptional regulator